MLSEVRKKKLSHDFRIRDTDGSGYLELVDFVGLLGKLCTLQGIGLETEAYRGRLAFTTEFWNQLSTYADENRDGRISEEEYCGFYGSMFASAGDATPDRMPPWFIGLTDGYFELLDVNGDGEIGLEEYAKFCSVHDVGAGDAAKAFAKLDLNGDGGISKDEARQLVFEFYFSDDPNAAGSSLYGPLD